MKAARKTNHQSGLRAETIAAFLLRLKGYRILRTRWRTPVGEIDLLATRGKTLVIVEVKYRKTVEAALACVTHTQRQRLDHAMRYVVAGLPRYNNYTWRYDLMAMAPRTWPRHIISAWEGK